MIDHLSVMDCDSHIGLGYIYCDDRDQKEQTIENILGAIMVQLLNSLPEIPVAVSEIYGQRVSQNKPLDVRDASELLWKICAQFRRVYICLDALDELQPKYLEGLLKLLCDVPSAIHIFLTGRPLVQGIIQKFAKTDTGIIIEAQDQDIQRFVEHEIGGPSDLEPEAMDEILRKMIIDKVIHSAKGLLV